MTWDIDYTDNALKDLSLLHKREPSAYAKALKLIGELSEHPRMGTGHPKPLGGDLAGQWSRKITKKHRLVYKIEDEKVVVLVVSAYGHYDDK